METLLSLILKIIAGIDRISFSIPVKYKELLLSQLFNECNYIKEKFLTKYRHHTFETKSKKEKNTFTVKIGLCNNDVFERIYLEAYHPNTETQEYFKNLLLQISNGSVTGFLGIIIQQVEVSYDIFCVDEADVHKVKIFIGRHVVCKHARSDSYNTFKSTYYIGNHGNIRKGIKGVRCYLKPKFGTKQFARFEMQFNRGYNLKHDITLHSLPLNPLSFHILDHVEILDSFSATGIRNLSRSILRKQGIVPSCNDFNRQLNRVIKEVKASVISGSRGPTTKVHRQIAELNLLKEKYQLSVNCKQYFPPMDDVRQLINCHAAVGYEEDYCSKRMLFCQA